MQGVRVLARALASAGRQQPVSFQTKLHARESGILEIIEGFPWCAQQWRKGLLGRDVGGTGVRSFASSPLSRKV